RRFTPIVLHDNLAVCQLPMSSSKTICQTCPNVSTTLWQACRLYMPTESGSVCVSQTFLFLHINTQLSFSIKAFAKEKRGNPKNPLRLTDDCNVWRNSANRTKSCLLGWQCRCPINTKSTPSW